MTGAKSMDKFSPVRHLAVVTLPLQKKKTTTKTKEITDGVKCLVLPCACYRLMHANEIYTVYFVRELQACDDSRL